MIQDKELTFSDEQAITATANSTNVVDLGAADMDKGEPLYLNAQVIEDFAAAGAGTLTVSLETDSDEAFGSAETLVTTAAIAKGTLLAGYFLPISLIPANVKRYVRLVYTVGTGPMTAGKITAFVGGPRQSNG